MKEKTGSAARELVRTSIAVVLVTILALALRWYYVTTALVNSPVRGDAIQYFNYAWNIVHHHVFSMAAPDALVVTPDSFRDPGYPLLLAAWMAVTDDFDLWYVGVLLTQAVLGAVTAGMTILLARFWLPLKWAICAGLLVAVWPHSVTIPDFLLSETLYGFLVLLAVLLYARVLSCGGFAVAAAAGTCFGLAILVNPVLLPLVVLLPLLALWRGDAPKRLLLAFALCASALPVAWNMRSALLVQTSHASTDRALQNLVQGSWPGLDSAWRESVGLEPEAAREMPSADREARMAAGRDKMAPIDREVQVMNHSPSQGFAMMAARFSEHPTRYMWWYLVEKPVLLWSWDIRIGQGDVYINPTRNSPLQTVPSLRVLVSLCRGLNPILAIGMLIAGMLVIARRRTSVPMIGTVSTHGAAVLYAVAWLLAYVTLLHTLLQAEPRYSIPYRPFEIALAVTGIAWMVQWMRKHSSLSKPPSDRELTG